MIATSDAAAQREAEIAAALPRFIGTILQRPPAFSAIKVDGERAYDLARAGETVELAPRPVTIDELTLVSHDGERSIFEMACEKGTYVRALARDLAEALGTPRPCDRLRRTAVAGFTGSRSRSASTRIEAAADRDALLLPASIGAAPSARTRHDAGRCGAAPQWRRGAAARRAGAGRMSNRLGQPQRRGDRHRQRARRPVPAAPGAARLRAAEDRTAAARALKKLRFEGTFPALGHIYG